MEEKKIKAEEKLTRSPYNDEELEYFRGIILRKKAEAEKDLEMLAATLKDSIESAGDDTAYSFHMADAGTDAEEREKNYMLVNRTKKFLKYLDEALVRINNKTYGICKVTGKKIAKGRLEAVPHTQISIEAKLKRR